jgi:ubiquinone/menaquinone biosynthesis C-methylase UbiE
MNVPNALRAKAWDCPMSSIIEYETIPCPLCRSPDSRVLLTNTDYGERVPGTFRMVRCIQCELYYQNPRPTLATIGVCYPDHYSAYTAQGLRSRRKLLSWITQRGMRRRLTLLDQAIPNQTGQLRQLLDVGSGAGVFLEAAKQYGGWQLHGLEPNARAAQVTQERTGIPIFNGTLEAAAYPAQSFDAITMWDVLEHLHDPVASLRELQRLLKPGGAVFIRVPNAASYTRMLAGRYWAGYDLPRHMTVFSPATLQRALLTSGFGEIRSQYTSGSYLFLIHSLRFALGDNTRLQPYAARVYQWLYHPILRGVVGTPLTLADKVGGGGALEVLARPRS